MSLLINLVLLCVTLSSFLQLVKGKDQTLALVDTLTAKEKTEEGSGFMAVSVTEYLNHAIYGYLGLQVFFFTHKPLFGLVWLALVCYMWQEGRKETDRIRRIMNLKPGESFTETTDNPMIGNAIQAFFYVLSVFVLCYPFLK